MLSEWHHGEYVISTDRDRLDVALIHKFLSSQAYWAMGRPRETVERALRNSLPFGLFQGSNQLAFARVVTDYATFAWLADVFVLPEHRGLGLSKLLLQVILAHPELQGLRRWVLATRDAQELYRRFGFQELDKSLGWMEKFNANA
jgi:GNAT superfamily N-acetyltransferase